MEKELNVDFRNLISPKTFSAFFFRRPTAWLATSFRCRAGFQPLRETDNRLPGEGHVGARLRP